MAYSNLNKLLFMLKVQNTYLDHKHDGITDKFIYNTYIKNTYNISYRCFWNYLNTNVKGQLKELGHDYTNNDK